MSDVESIGERLYRKVVTPIWSDDRRRYSAGCIVRGEGGAVKVVFYQYEIGRGCVGKCKPSAEMAGWLKQYGQELKRYVTQMDLRGSSSPRLVGTGKRKPHEAYNGQGERNQLTNEKREES